MCGLCGIFGVAEHWSDSAGAAVAPVSRRADRQQRMQAANRVLGLYGLRLADWGNRFTLTSRTGRNAIVAHFGDVWPAAERLAGRTCDPLDPAFLSRLEAMANQ